MRVWPSRALAALLSVVLLGGACGQAGGSGATTSDAAAPPTVTIAYQAGMSYATLIVLKQQKVLERAYPRTTFEWKILPSGAAIRDDLVAGQVQVGAGGIAPFLVGWDQGVGWKLLAALNETDMWLVARDPAIQSLRDFTPAMKIGLPAADSMQAVALRKGAQQQLGNARALDDNLVALAHPEGVHALSTGQIAGHFTAVPFQDQEVQAGGHVVLRSFDLFGRSTFNGVFMTQRFYDQYPQLARVFYQGVVDATKLINERPDEAAKVLSADDGNRVPPEQHKSWLTAASVAYTTVPHAVLRYAGFMQETGLIGQVPASMQDLELPPLGGAGD